MDDISLQPLQKVSLSELGALIAQAKEERWTELILLGPGYRLEGEREEWPEPCRQAPRVFQATERIGAAGAKALAKLTSLTAVSHHKDLGAYLIRCRCRQPRNPRRLWTHPRS